MTQKVYVGITDRMGCKVLVMAEGGEPQPLPPRNDLFNHSPDGFAWGYGGSGPAQLALAILADHLGSVIDKRHKKSVEAVDRTAVRLHQDFKWEVVARWSQANNFTLHSADIDKWLGERIG